LGRTKIQHPLSAGGMGEVYRARDLRLERSVAIKVPPADRSFKSISALQHPNICVVHDVGSQDGVEFRVMEYVSGQTLDKLIPPGGLTMDLAVKHAIQIAEALAYAHNAGSFTVISNPATSLLTSVASSKCLTSASLKWWRQPPQRTTRPSPCLRRPARLSALSSTCLPSRRKETPSTHEATSSLSIPYCTRCSPATEHFRAVAGCFAVGRYPRRSQAA
jgi:hypothetical protein